MNAGKDFKGAKQQAQANADRDGQPRKLFMYGGTWWIDRHDPSEPVTPSDAIVINPGERMVTCADCGQLHYADRLPSHECKQQRKENQRSKK